MSTLLNRLQTEHGGDYSRAITPVVMEEETHTGGCMRVTPQHNVYAKSIDRLIHSHGNNYQLIKYEDIISRLSDSLDNHGIDLTDSKIYFYITPTLSRMRLRVMFGDKTKFGSHTMQYNPDDRLQFGVEVVSSYDASVIFKLQAMFLRLICANGMKSFEKFNSSLKKHTTNFDVDRAFDKLKNLNESFNMMSNTFEIYQKTNITNDEKNQLFKAFSRGSEGKVYLLNQALEKQDNLTLWDIYNAFTNYSEHNKRSVSVGKRNKPKEIPKEYEIRQSNMDKIKSNEARSAEVQDFIHNNNLFIFYKGRGLSNQVHSN